MYRILVEILKKKMCRLHFGNLMDSIGMSMPSILNEKSFMFFCSVPILLFAQCVWGIQRCIWQLRGNECCTIRQRWEHIHTSLRTRTEVLHLRNHVPLSWRDEVSSICQWKPGIEPCWCTPGPWVQWSGPNSSSAPYQQYQQPIASHPFSWISV